MPIGLTHISTGTHIGSNDLANWVGEIKPNKRQLIINQDILRGKEGSSKNKSIIMIFTKSEPNVEELLSLHHFVSDKRTYIHTYAWVCDFSSVAFKLSCSNVQIIEYEYRCEYVQNTTECQERKFFFNYIEILYCSLAPRSDGQLYAFLMLFVGLIMLLFIVLGTTADKLCVPLTFFFFSVRFRSWIAVLLKVFVLLWKCWQKSWV